MKIDLIQARDLSSDLVARWDEIATSAPELASPYFRPQFTQAVAAVRDNVEIGVLRDGNTVVGFFPFERLRGWAARPAGGRLSDYQAVIAPSGLPWRVADLMQSCRLRSWAFDHHLASQTQLAPHVAKLDHSWRLDISAGFDAYVAGRKAAGAGALNEMLRKLRKLQREHAVRFEWHTPSAAVFDQLLAWKSDQYRRSGLIDLFGYTWILTLLKNIWRTHTPHFAGVLSVLYADEKIAAIHFGMQSGPLLHSWFPAYDTSLGKYSPGCGLLLLMIQHAAEQGVECIDLGKGPEEYKAALANATVPLAEGAIETRPVAAAFRRGWQQTRDWVRQSPIRERARMPIRWLRRMRDWLTLG